jgi:hypothetical protein
VVGTANQGQMLNIEAFQDLCRRAAIGRDPGKLEGPKAALSFMLRTEEIELSGIDAETSL